MPIQYGLMWKQNLTTTQKKKINKNKKKECLKFHGTRLSNLGNYIKFSRCLFLLTVGAKIDTAKG